jgi:hypothetical protein
MTTGIQPAIKTYKYTQDREQCSLYVLGGEGFPVFLNAEDSERQKRRNDMWLTDSRSLCKYFPLILRQVSDSLQMAHLSLLFTLTQFP